MAQRTQVWLTFCAFAGLSVGCTDFEVQEEVIDFRVLGIAAEPPEVLNLVIDLDLSCQGQADVPGLIATFVPPVELTVLTVNPEADAAPLSLKVEACPYNELLRCDAQDTDPELVVPVVDGLMGMPEEVEFTFAPTPGEVSRWAEEDDFCGAGGLFVMLDIEITQMRPGGDETIHAAKVVTYNAPFVPTGEGQEPPPPKLANSNPTMEALEFQVTPADDPDGSVTLPTSDEGVVRVPVGADVTLVPVLNGVPREACEDPEGGFQAAECYPVATYTDEDGVGYRILEEKLQLEYYATTGGFEEGDLESRDPRGDREDLENVYKTPEDLDAYPVDLWVILRDDRGGSSWVRRVLEPLDAGD